MMLCDRCGKTMSDTYTRTDGEGTSYGGGNCPVCGYNLCSVCAGEWKPLDGGEASCEACWRKSLEGEMLDCKTCNAADLCSMGVKKGDELCLSKRAMTASDTKGRKDDTGKLRWDLLPWRELEQVVGVLTYGAEKYGDHNWKDVKPFKERYHAASLRHLSAWAQGERGDRESGKAHLAHAVCNLLFLMWEDNQKYGTD